jgi:Tol biopolymer transport system component
VHYALSDDGLLAYVANRLGDPNLACSATRSLVWVDRQGRESPVPAAPVRQYLQVRLSPDGTRAAVQIAEGGSQPGFANTSRSDLWVWNFERSTLTRLTAEPGGDRFPAWTPDGKKITYSHLNPDGSSSHFSKLADGAGDAEPLPIDGAQQWTPLQWSADGAHGVLFNTLGTDIAFANTRGDRSARPLLTSSFTERAPSLSPDGRWMTYSSNEPGQYQIYVAPFPDVQRARWQISTEGGTEPVWSPAGREVFYRSESGGFVTAVPVSTTGSEIKVDAPTRLVRQRYVFGALTYDVSPDGQRFLMIKDSAIAGVETGRESIVLIENWLEELTEKMSKRQR